MIRSEYICIGKIKRILATTAAIFMMAGAFDFMSIPAFATEPGTGTAPVETATEEDTEETVFKYVQNNVVKGTGRVVKTNLEGNYYASGVAGIAMTDQEWSLQKDAGMAMVEYFFITTWDITQDTSPLAVKTFRIVADSEQAELGPVVQININKTFNGKMTSLEGNEAKFTTVVGLPDDFKGADYRYAVILVRSGGYFDILPDLDEDEKTVTFKAKAGNGAYALIRYSDTNG